MRWVPGRTVAAALAALLAVGGACAPASPPEGRAGPDAATADQPRPRKVLSIGIQREPASFQTNITGATSPTAGGASNVERIVHDNLTVETEIERYEPQLAAQKPSLEGGTWRINGDGTMETIWKLRPNIQWQDGAPFTADDLLFSFAVLKDPDLPKPRSAAHAVMQSATAADPLTLLVQWSQPYVDADHEATGSIVPRHLLEDLYRQDKANFVNSPLFTTEFVGLGPYRLARWEQGSHMEFARFEAYYQARPPLDTVIVRFIGDPNTMVANILAGSLDVVLPTGVDIEAALEVRQRWAGTGHQVTADPTGRLRHLELQYRPEVARPRNGLTDALVRQALYHAIDRQVLVDVMTQGLAPVADSWYPPNHALRKDLEASIPLFPYDSGRAQSLLARASWVRGTDGALVHQPSAERFEVEIWVNQGFGAEKELNIVADGWKAVGVQVTPFIIPAARLGNREFEATHPGPLITNPSGSAFYENRLHSRDIASAANRWSGRNRGGYLNPRVDEVLDKLQSTIDPRQRLELHHQLLREQMGDVALMPLYWEIVPVLAVKGVRGPKVVRNEATQNFYLWDRD